MTPPISLSHTQLNVVVRGAGLLPPDRRCAYLRIIAACLKAEADTSDATVAEAVQIALAELIEDPAA
jgi:hypothetical protein